MYTQNKDSIKFKLIFSQEQLKERNLFRLWHLIAKMICLIKIFQKLRELFLRKIVKPKISSINLSICLASQFFLS